jgi:hypothetical protein
LADYCSCQWTKTEVLMIWLLIGNFLFKSKLYKKQLNVWKKQINY